MHSGELKVREEKNENVTQIFLSGVIDKKTEPYFEAMLEKTITDGAKTVVLDLAELVHLNSGAIALVLKVAGTLKQQGRIIEIANVDSRTMNLLELIGLNAFIKIGEKYS